MSDADDVLGTSLEGLDWTDWLDRLDILTEEVGYTERLGNRHAAILLEQKPVLLVTFETHATIRARSSTAQPLGWTMAHALGWSHLCLVSEGQSWFRDRRVYGYFDRLVDDGFFEDFDHVIFYGAGACGYAACAFSVAAPGARVLALAPQATLEPRLAEWDQRFRYMRRTAFDDRYGYAPDMLDAADRAVILYDPEIAQDAMHATLFVRPNVTRFRTRFLGGELEDALLRMNLLPRMLAQLSAGKLTVPALARLWRARQHDRGYQFEIRQKLSAAGRHRLLILLCNAVLRQRPAQGFQRLREEARAALGLAEDEMPGAPERAPNDSAQATDRTTQMADG